MLKHKILMIIPARSIMMMIDDNIDGNVPQEKTIF